MEFYRRGNWIVGTPIWVFKQDQDLDDTAQKMSCPHPAWNIEEAHVPVDEETGKPVVDENFGEPVFIVKEVCPVCGGMRFRYIGESRKDEPFDYTIPTKGPWYERLYNLGNFTVLVRRNQQNPDVDPVFMTRVDTPSGAVYIGNFQMGTPLFSPAVNVLLEAMENMLRIGPEQYAKFRIVKEGRKTKVSKKEVMEDAAALARVVSEIGPESIASAQSIMQAEPKQEVADMEEWEIEQMEWVAKSKREALEKRRKKTK